MRLADLRRVTGVYAIKCTANGRVYIGQSINMGRRIGEHFSDLRNGGHHNKKIQEDYDRYGEGAFDYEVIREGTFTQEELDKIENEEIEKAGGIDSDMCYNVFSGGETGYTANQDFRDNVSQKLKGKKRSDGYREFAAKRAKKQWTEQEYRDTMVNSAKKQWESEEYRAIMRKAHLGNSEACGHILTTEKVREARRRHKTGETPTSLAKEYGVAVSTMYNALSGITWKNA